MKKRSNEKPKPGRLETKRRIIAYHEAGHAVTAIFLDARIQYVTLIPGEDAETGERYAGRLKRVEMPEPDEESRRRYLAECDLLIALAGPAAEEIFTGRKPHWLNGSSGDYRRAWELARWIHGYRWMPPGDPRGSVTDSYLRYMTKRVKVDYLTGTGWKALQWRKPW